MSDLTIKKVEKKNLFFKFFQRIKKILLKYFFSEWFRMLVLLKYENWVWAALVPALYLWTLLADHLEMVSINCNLCTNYMSQLFFNGYNACMYSIYWIYGLGLLLYYSIYKLLNFQFFQNVCTYFWWLSKWAKSSDIAWL